MQRSVEFTIERYIYIPEQVTARETASIDAPLINGKTATVARTQCVVMMPNAWAAVIQCCFLQGWSLDTVKRHGDIKWHNQVWTHFVELPRSEAKHKVVADWASRT
jgi:hypothetical protein